MTRRVLLLGGLLVAMLTATATCQAFDETIHGRKARARAMTYPWNGPYYHTMTGYPVPLVVPPTAEMQTNWGWGVGNTRVTPIDHQFSPVLPPGGAYGGGYNWLPQPLWPADTTHFGTYYIRGPW